MENDQEGANEADCSCNQVSEINERIDLLHVHFLSERLHDLIKLDSDHFFTSWNSKNSVLTLLISLCSSSLFFLWASHPMVCSKSCFFASMALHLSISASFSAFRMILVSVRSSASLLFVKRAKVRLRFEAYLGSR